MKVRAYYTPEQFSDTYTQVKDWAESVPAPSYVGKPAMTDVNQK
jgi:hypothetical protein